MQNNTPRGSLLQCRDGIINGVYHTQYDGRLAHEQDKYPRKRYQRFEWDKYTFYQNELYKKTVFGLKVYTEQERKALTPSQIELINKNHFRVQRALNVFKQQIANLICNQLLNFFFAENAMAQALQSKKYVRIDPDHHNTIPFSTLKVTKDQIIERLIAEKFLPQDFYQLKKKPKNLKTNGDAFHRERRSLTPA